MTIHAKIAMKPYSEQKCEISFSDTKCVAYLLIYSFNFDADPDPDPRSALEKNESGSGSRSRLFLKNLLNFFNKAKFFNFLSYFFRLFLC